MREKAKCMFGPTHNVHTHAASGLWRACPGSLPRSYHVLSTAGCVQSASWQALLVCGSDGASAGGDTAEPSRWGTPLPFCRGSLELNAAADRGTELDMLDNAPALGLPSGLWHQAN